MATKAAQVAFKKFQSEQKPRASQGFQPETARDAKGNPVKAHRENRVLAAPKPAPEVLGKVKLSPHANKPITKTVVKKSALHKKGA